MSTVGNMEIDPQPVCHHPRRLIRLWAMIHRKTLPNGIPVFVVENHASPVVSIHAVVGRGSVHEPSHLAGISHFLEHSLFKGTKKRRVGEIALEIESHGGEINAFTSFSETAYYTTIASRYFEVGLDVIADAISHPSFDPVEMEREKEVILEEIKRATDSPQRVLSLNVWKTAFAGTPYGRPVLGFVDTVKKINAKTLSRYFHDQYHAATISLFIVGDVDHLLAENLASRRLSKIPRKPIRNPGPFKFPKLSVAKGISAAKDLEETHIQVAFPVPGIHDRQTPVRDLMCSALGQGESSRLYQRLVKETALALDTQIGLTATTHCGLVTIYLLVAPEKAADAVAETYRLLTSVAKTGLTDEEVDRIKTSLESDTIFAKETVDGYARRLGYYYCEFGNPEHEATYLEELLSVTPTDATDAISTVFSKKAILSTVHPNAAPLDPKCLETVKNGFQPTAHRGIAPAEIQKETRQNITFLTKKSSHLPTLSVRLLTLGGSREESAKELGLGTLFSRVWSSGTKNYTSLELARILESLGASINTYCGRNTLGLSVECLSKHWHSLKPLVAEILGEPTFPKSEFDTEKGLLLREILSERDSPGALVHLNLMSRLFPNHPYGRSSLGQKETVETLTREDCVRFYRESFHRQKLIVSTVGDFRSECIRDIETLCQLLPASGKPFGAKQPVLRPTATSAITAKKTPLSQSHILVGYVTASLYDPDRYALKILASALSGQGGRLFLELRDRQSLAYTVSPMQSDGPEAGTFSFYIGCSPEKWQKAIRGIRLEIEKILTEPLPKEELQRAKQYWLGRFDLDMQRASAQCFTYGLDEVYGLGYDHSLRVSEIIRSIDAKSVRETARRHLSPENATLSIVHADTITESEVLDVWRPTTTVRRPKNQASAEAI